MGSLAPLDPPASAISCDIGAVRSGKKKRKDKHHSTTPKNSNEGSRHEDVKEKGVKSPHSSDEKTSGAYNKRPRRAAACTNFKERAISEPKHDILIETDRDHLVDDEIIAVRLTASSPNEERPNRRLTDFTFHNSEGGHQPIEMLEVDDVFVSGLILHNEEERSVNGKQKSARCEGFGRMESWNISGYEDGVPVIWVSTDFADYECLKPSTGYKKIYDHFFEKARASIEVYKKVSKASGGSPDITLDELLAGVVRSMSGNRCFSSPVAIKDFIISQGQFIYNQLIGLDDDTCKKNGQVFAQLPVLVSLRDESGNQLGLQARSSITSSSGGCLTIGPKVGGDDQNGSCNLEGDDENEKLAMLLQEEENWRSMKQQQRKNQNSNPSSKFYIKINEDEIANDYPLPAFYSPCDDEMDEYVLVDNDFSTCDTDLLPRSMLYNWSLYNSDSRLISLELLPMKPCADIDVTIFGSGLMTADDGSGFDLDSDPNICSSGAGSNDPSGIPIYLSSIKEWMIEFGSTMVFVSIRTDMAWYRLGKPSKQYAPWYKPVLKTARLAISIITMLKEQSRIARLSFSQIIKKISEFPKDHKAFISSDLSTVERYVVVHGQIILQQFSEFPDDKIKRCAFVFDLAHKMEERRHTKWVVKKKKVEQKHEPNLNPRAAMQPVVTKRKLMQATTTRLISRIWGDYYSNYSPEDTEKGENLDPKEGDDVEQQAEDNEDDEPEEERTICPKQTRKPCPLYKRSKSFSTSHEIKWVGTSVGKTTSGSPLYRGALVRGDEITVGGSVVIETDESSEYPSIYFVEFMLETKNGSKMFHGRKFQRGSETVLGNAANERELFLMNECTEINLDDAKQAVVVDIRLLPWGHQHRKENSNFENDDRERAEERKRKGLPMEYYCKNVYWPERGGFFSISHKSLGLGTGVCNSCKLSEDEKIKEKITINSSKSCFTLQGMEYSVNDFVFVSPQNFSAQIGELERFKGGRNIGLKAYVICQFLDLVIDKAFKVSEVGSTPIKVRRFFRPEDISAEKAHCSDIREVYYSEEIYTLPIDAIEGKCQVRKKHDLPSPNDPVISEHIFFCEHIYDPSNGSIKLLPARIKICYSHDMVNGQTSSTKKKGKCIEGDEKCEPEAKSSQTNFLATLDIFSGCGGLSEGLAQSGISKTKWAIEYEEPAGDAFKLNHPDALVFVNNCNVILRAIMEKCGDLDDCISTTEAAEMAESLGDKMIDDLPLPGQVDFINGGPPCQGFSGMNRFNQSTWSRVQCEMILPFLSFAEYFRPKYFLLENVRNFVSFNKGQTFRLTLASLLEMGYQVRFGILEAGAYGVSQSRKRAFIWAASPEATLPEWPEPMHVFAVPELKITLSDTEQYAAVRSTANGAPYRAITVRDTIGDLPPVGNGASRANLEYPGDAVSWFQKKIRGDNLVLTDHISKEMNELNCIRCQRIPKRPGADWHDLPEEKVKLSNGQVVDLIPWCLPNTAKRHNQWKGLFGRLDWDGNFPTSVTDPQPMGKVGMCFHPDQDRIITVRECARSQGFPDGYRFSGNIQHKHRQIGNAVPPPLAFALGLKLKEAVSLPPMTKA